MLCGKANEDLKAGPKELDPNICGHISLIRLMNGGKRGKRWIGKVLKKLANLIESE